MSLAFTSRMPGVRIHVASPCPTSTKATHRSVRSSASLADRKASSSSAVQVRVVPSGPDRLGVSVSGQPPWATSSNAAAAPAAKRG